MHLFRRRIIGSGLIVLAWTVMIHSAKASSAPVPAQVQFVNPPLTFGWSQLMSYRLKLTSVNSVPIVVQLTFEPTFELDPNAPAISVKGGVNLYHRTYHLMPGQTQSLGFRIYVPPMPPIGAYVNWCLGVTIEVKGAAPQGAKSCALSPGK